MRVCEYARNNAEGPVLGPSLFLVEGDYVSKKGSMQRSSITGDESKTDKI